MTTNHVIINFTRSISDDMDVVRSTGWTKERGGLKKQLVSEFVNHLATERMHINGMHIGMSDQYTVEVRYDLTDDAGTDPTTIMSAVRDQLQAAYDDEYAGGHFEIDKVVLDGVVHEAAELVASLPGNSI